MVMNLPAMQDTWVGSLDWEDPPGEGNGYPLQYSCVENPMDRGAWWVIVLGVFFLLLPSQRPLDNQEGGQGRVPPDIRPLPGNQLSQQIGGRWAHSLPLLLAAGCVALEALPSLSGPQSHLQMELIIPTEDSVRQ